MRLVRIMVGRIYGANTYLKPFSRGKVSRLYLHPEARAYKERIIRELSQLQIELPAKRVGLLLIFGVNRKKDTSNMVKLTEDAIAQYFGLNDVEWNWIIAWRKTIPKGESEWVAFAFSEAEDPWYDEELRIQAADFS